MKKSHKNIIWMNLVIIDVNIVMVYQQLPRSLKRGITMDKWRGTNLDLERVLDEIVDWINTQKNNKTS